MVQYKYKSVQILELSTLNKTLYYIYDVKNLSPETVMEMQIPVWKVMPWKEDRQEVIGSNPGGGKRVLLCKLR